MRKPSRAGGVAVGALAVALTAGAFAFAPASAAVTTVTGSKVPASIQPSTPLKAVGCRAGRGRDRWPPRSPAFSPSTGPGTPLASGTTTFRFVSAQFTAPPLDCTAVTAANGAWSAHWVGLDGFRSTSTTVEQIGLLAGCDGTSPAGICAVLGDVPERGERPEHHRQSRRRDQPFRVLQQVHPQVHADLLRHHQRPAIHSHQGLPGRRHLPGATAPRRSAKHRPKSPDPPSPSCRWLTSRPQTSPMSPSPTPPARTAAGCSPRSGTPSRSPKQPVTGPTSPSPVPRSPREPPSTSRLPWP